MPKLTVHRVVPHPRDKIFQLVADVERYPEFLPGWQRARIIDRNDGTLTVEQQLGLTRMNWRFRTTAHLEPPRHIRIEAHERPFRYLDETWTFDDLGRGRTLVTFKVDYELSEAPLRGLVSKLFEDGFRRTLRAFERRADEVLGQ